VSAEPLNAAERETFEYYAATQKGPSAQHVSRWWEGYHALRSEWYTAEATLVRVRSALAALDGHTCHGGHTDADHLGVVAEVMVALEGAA
jgi:hypothetical protein